MRAPLTARRWSIDMETGAAAPFTIGHRNPQGLYIDPDGNIWSSEHGPKGGDELNLLVKGRNYGWPIVTYGTELRPEYLATQSAPGAARGLRGPRICVGAFGGNLRIASIEKELFARWKHDLIVGSLGVPPCGGCGPSTEGSRLSRRSISASGSVTWSKARMDGSFSGPRRTHPGPTERFARGRGTGHGTGSGRERCEASALRGELMFGRCVGCHTIGGNGKGIGPMLGGVVGRRIASEDGFNYSDALKTSLGRLDKERLDALLADPETFAPGTSMQMDGVSDPADRAALIQYLKAR